MSQALQRCLLLLAVYSCGLPLLSAEIETIDPGQPERVESDSVKTEQPGEDVTLLEKRRRAIEAIEDKGLEARSSVNELLDTLQDPSVPFSLRRTSLAVLGRIGWDGEETTQVLLAALANPEEDLEIRRGILLLLADRGRLTPLSVKTFSALLANPNEPEDLRQQVLFVLGQQVNPNDVETTLTALVTAPHDSLKLRLAALRQLLTANRVSPETVNALASVAANRQEPKEIRTATVDALRSNGKGADAAAPALMTILQDTETDLSLRLLAIDALAPLDIAPIDSPDTVLYDLAADTTQPVVLRQRLVSLLPSPEQWPQPDPERWRQSLRQRDQLPEVRRLAIRSLAQSSLATAEDLTLAAQLLNDPDEDLQVRLTAGDYLQDQRQPNQPTWASLTNLLTSPGEPLALRQRAASLLTQHCFSLLERPDQLSREGLAEHLQVLGSAQQLLNQSLPPSPTKSEYLSAFDRVQSVLQREHASRRWDRMNDWIQAHPFLAVALGLLFMVTAYSLILCVAWALLARAAPGLVWRLNSWGAKRTVGPLGLHHLLWASRWYQSPQVLNFGCGTLLPKVTQLWTERREQQGATPFIDFPIEAGGESYPHLPWTQVFDQISRPDALVVIQGNRGTGKSSLAVETALRVCLASPASSRYGDRLVPIPVSPSVTEPGIDLRLAHRLAHTLSADLDAASAVSPSDLKALLSANRIVLVLDDWSAWPEDTARVWNETLAANAGPQPPQLATAEHSFSPPRPPTYQINIRPLNGQAAASFLADYLSGPAILTDEQSLAAHRYWADLTDSRPVPVELVLQLAKFLRRDPAGATRLDRPAHLGDLIQQNLLEEVDPACPTPGEHRNFIHGLEEAVWEELSQSSGEGLPERITTLINDADLEPEILTKNGSLARLVGLISPTAQAQRDATGASLADYLAANHLIRRNGANEQAWRSLFRSTPAPGEAQLSGLGQALLDCNRSLAEAHSNVPPWVNQELSQRLGTESEERKEWRQQKEIRQLIADIIRPENPDRSAALEELAHLGSRAVVAVPDLIRAFEDPRLEVDVRQGALTGLGLLGPLAAAALPTLLKALNNRREHLFFRVKALELIADLGPRHDKALAALVGRFADTEEQEFFRLRAGQALLDCGADLSEIQSLVDQRPPSDESPALSQIRKAIQDR